MTIQQLTDQEFEQAFQLSCYAFHAIDPEASRPVAELEWKEVTSFGEVSDGQVLAKLELLPFSVNIYGKAMKMAGVGGVATYPEQRRKGLIKQLLIHSLKDMRSKGQLLSYLAPFSVGFYRKYGWEMAFDEVTYTLEKTQLPKPNPLVEGQIERVSYSDKRIRTVYENAQSHGKLNREEWWWKSLEYRYRKHNIALYTDQSGSPLAYMVYQFKDRQLETEELLYTEPAGLDALLAFIGQHDSMIQSAEITVPASDHLNYVLPDPKTKAEIMPYFMARVVDVQAFLLAFPFLKSEGGNYTIQVEDPCAEWNNKTFSLSITNEEISCEVTSDMEAPSMKMSIQTLSGLMLGYRRPSLYIKQGLIKGDKQKIEAFVSHIPDEEPALVDFF
ncbi:GNAT family N-acetyltransferase [Alkalicoccobacillus porphyridii]|uniref:GNAT family N-acetyltransferase n=1 Tax=Alkalicoccobacillus porphyridii TaxID=2597270 RepID=A0A554A275_9BACI|nr:GNAT family N-acetyltransferase [Alkalicoccobacillus porphyridii]TSB47783.1 GNAT family N-acetyltransferase [Alkalicoccobacillus porphyridii]